MLILLVIFLVAPVSADNQPGLKGWPAILQDYKDGLIDSDQKIELALTLLINPQNLPPRYQIDKPMRDATSMILDIMTVDGKIVPEIVNQHDLVLTRVNKQNQYNTPEGHFRIHYDTSGTHVVYQATVDIDPADGVPDFVNRTAEYFERSWYYQSDTLGYDTPPFDGGNGGGTDLYDVYMHRYSGAYGVTWPESQTNQRPGRNNDMTSYIYVDPAYNGFGYPDRTLPMKVTSAHEFFHAVQFAYNASAGGWFMENCATWMEDMMWDDINDNYYYMSSFFNNPHKSIHTSNGGFEYGAFVWPTYLQERYGHELIKTIWEWTIYTNALNAVLAVLDEYASGIIDDYSTFATWNYLTGTRNDGEHYEEGSAYSSVRIMRTHTSYPTGDNTSWMQPELFGCNYVLFARAGNTGNLRITFDGGDSGEWIVPVVKSTGTNQHVFDFISLNNYDEGEILIPNFENYVGVAIIPCLVGGPSSNFDYSAELDTTTSIDEISGNLPDDFKLHGNYPNPFNGSTIISFEAPESYSGNAEVDIYDILGKRVNKVDVLIKGGQNHLLLDDWNNDNLVSGLYYYRLIVGDEILTGKMTYLK
ncbi:MAG: T9SS type A sorting domain-containing protein [candidate division Zixibacteria bacterium]|nr:T9SS type A sorting domain-containing protein [candidate division Zixibacteria bacterium]